MINTLFGSNNLDTAWAFLASLAIGFAFGFFLPLVMFALGILIIAAVE